MYVCIHSVGLYYVCVSYTHIYACSVEGGVLLQVLVTVHLIKDVIGHLIRTEVLQQEGEQSGHVTIM